PKGGLAKSFRINEKNMEFRWTGRFVEKEWKSGAAFFRQAAFTKTASFCNLRTETDRASFAKRPRVSNHQKPSHKPAQRHWSLSSGVKAQLLRALKSGLKPRPPEDWIDETASIPVASGPYGVARIGGR